MYSEKAQNAMSGSSSEKRKLESVKTWKNIMEIKSSFILLERSL